MLDFPVAEQPDSAQRGATARMLPSVGGFAGERDGCPLPKNRIESDYRYKLELLLYYLLYIIYTI